MIYTHIADRVIDSNGVSTIEERGGIARLATLLNQQCTENPNNIVMNIGVAGYWDFAYSPDISRMRFSPLDIFGLIPESDNEYDARYRR